MTLQEFQDGYLSALSEIVDKGLRARILNEAGVPLALQPQFSNGYQFWNDVSQIIHAGSAREDFEGFIVVVARVLPGNKAFQNVTGKDRILQVLFLAASPDGETWLRVDREQRAASLALQSGKMRDYISLDVRQAVQRGDVLAELTRARPHLLHVSGHGDQDGQFLADDKRIDPAALASVIAELRKDGHPIAGVILNACWSAAAVPLLSAAGVVAMGWREPIIDEDAIAFSRSLYETLGNQPDPITADLAQCARIARANLAVLNLNPPDLEISRPGGAE